MSVRCRNSWGRTGFRRGLWDRNKRAVAFRTTIKADKLNINDNNSLELVAA